MNYSSFDKTTLWRSAVVFLSCCAMIAFLLYERRIYHDDLSGVLLFTAIAVSSLYRIFAYLKLDRFRKNASGEEEIVRAERRYRLVVSIFSNAVYLLFILLLVFLGVRKSIPVTFIIVCAAIALGFVWTLVLSIRNLRRFDRT